MSNNQKWRGLKEYSGENLRRVAMPLGGIGTGTFSIGGKGDLRDWEVMNRPGKGFIPQYSFFCIRVQDSDKKSKAIAKILELKNITYKETICFGDGFNDEKMLLSSGKALIMGNAVESLKNKLPHLEVILNNQSDGVAQYLSKEIV